MIQGIFIIILTLMLIPFAMAKINLIYGKTGVMGTFEAFHDNLPEAFFQILGSPNLPQFTWYYIASFAVMAIINTAVQANQLTAAGSAKDDETARVGFITGIFIKRYCGVIWGFIAMMTLLLYGTQVSDPDYVWGLATRELLPVGLVGLMIACLMAALMSTADALMLTSSSLLTNNVYRPLFPGRSDTHYVLAGRIFCLAYIIGGVAIAMAIDDVFALFLFMITFNSMIAATFWLGMLWRRSTRAAAWTSIIVTSLFTLILPFLAPIIPGVRSERPSPSKPGATRWKTATMPNRWTSNGAARKSPCWDKLDAAGKAEGNPPGPARRRRGLHQARLHQPTEHLLAEWPDPQRRRRTGRRRPAQGRTRGARPARFRPAKNKHAWNESMTALLRVAVPFGLLILVSLITAMIDRKRLDFFYARLRTPVRADHDLDAAKSRATTIPPAVITSSCSRIPAGSSASGHARLARPGHGSRRRVALSCSSGCWSILEK